MEAVECGAASLSMILAHYGTWIPLENLRVDCGVSRDGSKASHLLKAARTYGLECKGFRRELEDIKQATNFPLIVFWNFNHFLVMEGYQNEKVYLNDPARGPVTIDWDEFDESFTGVVLEFSEGPDFAPTGNPPSSWQSLRQRLGSIREGLLLIALIGLALVIPGIVIPTFSQVFVDDILVNQRTDWLPILLAAMAITALVRASLTWLQSAVTNRMNNKMDISWTCRLFEHVLRLPLPFFGQRFAGDISTRINSNDRISSFIADDLGQIAIAIVSLLFFVLVMLSYDVWLTLAGIGVASVNIISMRWSAEKQKLTSQKLAQDEGKLTAAVAGGISMIETLKATGTENDFFSRVAGHQARIFNGRQEMGRVMTLVNSIPLLLLILNSAVILGLGGIRVMDGDISMGMLVAFQSLMASFMLPVQQLVGETAAMQQLEGDMRRVDDVFKYPQAPAFAEQQKTQLPPDAARLQGFIELKSVSYGYSIQEPALIEDFSLKLNPGQRLALVGGSGSGKSTIANLISGIAEPWDGKVLIDDIPRLQIPNLALTDTLAVVDQKICLFDGTIRDNLTMWDNTIEEESLIQAAKDACIHDIIMARTGAYQSRVAEGGKNFSGGQAQRLEIARALVRNPNILILDEATSALDTQTEMLIDQNLRRRGCTCIIVAHRLSTIRDCDEIVVLEKGKVLQRGTHNDMKDVDGPYKRLIGQGSS